MTIRDILKKKEKIEDDSTSSALTEALPSSSPPAPEFKFVRTTTNTTEDLFTTSADNYHPETKDKENQPARRPSPFRRFSKSPSPSTPPTPESTPTKSDKRLSNTFQKLHLSPRNRSSSVNLPTDLPDIPSPDTNLANDSDELEARWEKRATLLAQGNAAAARSRSTSTGSSVGAAGILAATIATPARVSHSRKISDHAGDVNIQEAIQLHEAGDLEASTAMFGRLADPHGSNNALSQVLYGLALRHGWGVPVDASLAVTYLTAAASNSAGVESAALASGLAHGGAAKGELVLAIFELGNSFRHGWGVQRDAVAARQYYETAANLGDVDAMGELAWCCVEGFGGKKDKMKSAAWLRKAEGLGKKEIGNSWIWKPKYDPKSVS